MNSHFQTGKEILKAQSDSIWACGFSTNGSLITASSDQSVKVWNTEIDPITVDKSAQNDTKGNKCIFDLKPHHLSALSVSCHPTKNIIATSSFDGNIRFFNIDDGSLIKEVYVGPTDLWTIAFSSTGSSIATSTYNGTIKVWPWDQDMTSSITEFKTTNSFALALAFKPNDTILATSHSDGTINIFNTSKEAATSLCFSVKKHSMPIRCLKYSPDSKMLFSGSNDMTINCYDADTEGSYTVLKTFRGHTGFVLGLDITKDNKLMASVSTDKTCKIWDIQTGECVQTFSSPSIIWSVAFNKDGSKLAYTTEEGTINILLRKDL